MKNADMPAMPIFNKNGEAIHHSSAGLHEGCLLGVTKREMFAMHAMQGLLSSASDSNGIWTNEGPELVANEAVRFADALLAELDK